MWIIEFFYLFIYLTFKQKTSSEFEDSINKATVNNIRRRRNH